MLAAPRESRLAGVDGVPPIRSTVPAKLGLYGLRLPPLPTTIYVSPASPLPPPLSPCP